MTRGADEEVELRLVRRQASRPAGRLAAAASGGRTRRSRRGRRRRAGQGTGPARQAAPSKISDIGANFDYKFPACCLRATTAATRAARSSPAPRRKGTARAAAATRPRTDARNGRGSGDPASTEPGRSPIWEQSDVFFDDYGLPGGDQGHGNGEGMTKAEQAFLLAPCPAGMLAGKH